MKNNIILWIGLGLLTGCTIGPNYKKPSITIPSTYHEALPSAGMGEASIADQKWQDVFQDPLLRRLIARALAHNRDLSIAADHILEAGAQLGITSSYQLPTINAQAISSGERVEKIRSADPYNLGAWQINAAVGWDIDFWGKYRRMIETAKANFVASQWARQEIVTTLIAQVGRVYFQLRALDMQLDIASHVIDARARALELTRSLVNHGALSLLDLHQAEESLYTAREQAADLTRLIRQQEHLMSILLGENPNVIERGWSLIRPSMMSTIPAGMPASLLLRRADIRQAQESLIAFNAAIGTAQGGYFPDISLTGMGGYQSSALSKLLNGPSGLWDIAGSLTQPIFTAGRTRAQIQLAKFQFQEALHNYQKTVLEAFKEVSDALSAYRENQAFRHQQDLLMQSAKDTLRLSFLRYQGGRASYLNVLDSQIQYLSARATQAQAALNQMQALVDVYQALGGGWQAR